VAITWADVVAIAPSLSTGVGVTAQAMIIAFVTEVVDDSDDAWGDGALYTMGASLLAAHFGSLVKTNSANGAQGPVTSMAQGDTSKSFAAPTFDASEGALGATSYGRNYLALVATLPSSFGLLL
jgi:hypothetical protein